jgi:hypothetical protein
VTAAQQLTKAVQIAKKNRLTKCHVLVRYPDDLRREFAVIELSTNPAALRGIEVEIADHNGNIVAVVGDQEDGRKKNVLLALD